MNPKPTKAYQRRLHCETGQTIATRVRTPTDVAISNGTDVILFYDADEYLWNRVYNVVNPVYQNIRRSANTMIREL